MRRLIALLLPVALGLVEVRAAPLRITTWNLDFRPSTLAAPADARRLAEIAATLESLNADVVLLQAVPDRETCERLAALLPGGHYQVAACSAFSDASGHKQAQLALLTRKPIVTSGWEPWKAEKSVAPPGGLAWIAIRHGTETALVCCVDLKDNPVVDDGDKETQLAILTRELAAGQLVRQARALAKELHPAPAAVLVGGSFNTDTDQPQFVSENTLRLLQDDGFVSAFHDMPASDRITRPAAGRGGDATADYLLARGAPFLGTPIIVPADRSGHLPVTADLVVPLSLPVAAAPVPAPPRPGSPWFRPWTLAAPAALALLFLAWWFTSRKRFYQPARMAAAGSVRRLTLPGEADADPAEGPLSDQARDPWEDVLATTGAGDFQLRSLEQRALAAEERAAQAAELMRRGLIPHLARLMKDRLFRGVATQRAQLLAMQQAGALRVAELEQRLAAIQVQLQHRLGAYEKRIADLEKELAAKDQANRELLATSARMLEQALEDARATAEETRNL